MNIDNQAACISNSQRLDDGSAVVSRLNFRLALVVLALASFSEFAGAQVLPNDAKPTCTFESGEFAGWFATGVVTVNGVVNPADSLTFRPSLHVPPNDPDCNFYKWSEQMFLWVTSPADHGERVFHSPEFYGISAAAPDGTRTLQPLTQNIDLFVLTSKPVEQGGEVGSRAVLMAGNNSLVYYGSQVNDVYAYFLTGTKNGGITPKPTRFPIEQPELDKITAFAASHGTRFRDSNALVVEVKSAWVETAGLDASKYITMTATIPTYTSDPSNSRWTPNGSKQAQLALVGLHVAGSMNGHPEMVWASFEHIDNTPMASYSYNNTSNQTIQVDPNQAGTWLFSAHNCTVPFNNERMHARNVPYIDAFPGKTIGPIDTCRENAWGSSPNDSRLAEKNTQIIAINNSIIGMLPSGDVRKNYLLIGTTWNLGVGTSRLANTTLETFVQDKNCFSCHNGDLAGGNLSHMFGPLMPLFPSP